MRSFKRLCEVIDTINPDLYAEEQMLLQMVIDEMSSTMIVGPMHWEMLCKMQAGHASPHIQELTEQTLKYHQLADDECLSWEEMQEVSL